MQEEEEEEDIIGVVNPKFLKDREIVERSIADRGWAKRGWTGRSWPGRYVGCPMSPDGSEGEMKRISCASHGEKYFLPMFVMCAKTVKRT